MSGLDEMPESVRNERMPERIRGAMGYAIIIYGDMDSVSELYQDTVYSDFQQQGFTVVQVVGIPDSGKSVLSLVDALRR